MAATGRDAPSAIRRAMVRPARRPATIAFINAMLTALFVLVAPVRAAPATTLDFESLLDGDVLTEQYAGLGVHVVGGGVALVAGNSLNEIQFPPHSGVTVLADGAGPLEFRFDTPIDDFAAYFTYLAPLSLNAYDGSGAVVASAISNFGANLAADPAVPGSAGDPGSAPNDLLSLAYAAGFTRVVLAGAPDGASFVLDDVRFSSPVRFVPLPGTLLLAVTGLALLPLRRR